ncbi:MAG: histidine--tRNA ligase [Nitrospirales bacterium]
MIRRIKGVKDILPDDIPKWDVIETAARRLATIYGFREIRIPIFEQTDLFARSIGTTTDIVEKEMYTFQDLDKTSLTLRPEGTAGAVRAYIENNLGSVPSAQKMFYLGPMFRHESPQAGRQRQFHQLGVEFFGNPHVGADVEVMAFLWHFFADLKLRDLTLEVNSLGEPADRSRYRTLLVKFLEARRDCLCVNCRGRLERNPFRILDCKEAGCRDATRDAPMMTDHLSERARSQFEDVRSGLSALGIPYTVNPRLVRGLDYYTLTAFEVTSLSPHLGAQNALGGGGRYDGLVEGLGGPSTPAVGFAAGLERIALVLPPEARTPQPKMVFVAAFGKDGEAAGTRVLQALRALGVSSETLHGASTLKAHLRQADRRGALLTAIIGDDEAAEGVVLLRDMTTKAQEKLPLSSAPDMIAARVFSA